MERRATALPRPMLLEAVERDLLAAATDCVTRGMLLEEVGNADFNCALPFLMATHPYELMRLPGVPEAIRKPLLGAVGRGEKIIAICFTEPAPGSDMACFESRAIRDCDSWVLDAVKNSISWADAYIGLECIGAAQASVDETCVFARQRVAMGRPISQDQSVSFALAEAETRLEAA